jgi:phage terminase small subunit
MQRGNKPNPSNVVELRNNAGKKTLLHDEPVTEPILDVVNPPRKLKGEAKKEWFRVMPFCIRNRIIGPEALGLLATYCYLHSQEVAAEKRGELLPAAYLAQYRMLAEIFGFTPAGRTRIKAGNAKKNGDEERFFG